MSANSLRRCSSLMLAKYSSILFSQGWHQCSPAEAAAEALDAEAAGAEAAGAEAASLAAGAEAAEAEAAEAAEASDAAAGAGLSPQAVKAKAAIKAANTDVFFMVGSFIKLKGSVYYSK